MIKIDDNTLAQIKRIIELLEKNQNVLVMEEILELRVILETLERRYKGDGWDRLNTL